MQIVNRGIMFLTFSFDGGVGMGDHEQWARAIKAAAEAKAADSNRATQAVAMNRNIVAEQTPLVWKELCEEFKSCCEAINTQMNPERKLGLHLTGPHDFMVRPDAMEAIVLGHYAHDTHHIKIQTSRGAEWFAPQAVHVGTGKVVLVSTSTRTQKSVESIARDAIAEYYT